MKLWRPFLFVLFLLVCGSHAAQAQQRPLFTEDVDIVEPGHVRAQLGFEFLQDQRFGLSGLRGDLTRAGIVGIHFGLSPNVEFSVEGTVRNFLNIREAGQSSIPLLVQPNATSTSDVGDFTLWTKIKLRKETKRGPSLGFRLGVTMPNSDQARGIGLNTINIYTSQLVGKTFANGRLRLFGNVGAAILTDPLSRGAQQDVFTYGVAGIYKLNDRINVLSEVQGRYNPRKAKVGLESQAHARFGLQVKAGGLQWDVAGIRGLTEFSSQTGVYLGVTYEFKAFEPIK